VDRWYCQARGAALEIGPHKLSPGLLVDALSKRRDQKMKRPGQKEQTKVVDSREGSCVLATGSLELAAWWQRIDIERREQFHGRRSWFRGL
jgi:hypothetical protein